MDLVTFGVQLLNAIQYGMVLFLVASGLTLPSATALSHTVKDWKHRPEPVANDRPAVYLIGR